MWKSLISNFSIVVLSLRCYCNPCIESIGKEIINETCPALPNSKCFASITESFKNGQRYHEMAYGCLPGFEGGTTMQVCKNHYGEYFTIDILNENLVVMDIIYDAKH